MSSKFDNFTIITSSSESKMEYHKLRNLANVNFLMKTLMPKIKLGLFKISNKPKSFFFV